MNDDVAALNSVPTEEELNQLQLTTLQYATKRYGFKPSFNQTYAVPDSPTGWWVTSYHFGIDQGPVALMIENYRTGLIWEIMRRCPYVKGAGRPRSRARFSTSSRAPLRWN